MPKEWALTWSPLEADTSRGIIKFDPIIPTVTKQCAFKRPVIVISSQTQQMNGLLNEVAKNKKTGLLYEHQIPQFEGRLGATLPHARFHNYSFLTFEQSNTTGQRLSTDSRAT